MFEDTSNIEMWATKHIDKTLLVCGVVIPVLLAVHGVLMGNGELTLRGLIQVVFGGLV